VIGAVGLMRTMSLQGRTEPLRIWGPKGVAQLMKRAEVFGGERLSFPVEVAEVTPGTPIARKEYAIVPYPVEHRGTLAVGYAFVEEERRGRFNPDLARELGIPEGPLWGKIHKGEPITLDDGRVIEASTLVGPTRCGRKLVISGDTRPCASTIAMSAGADLLLHEATFGDEEAARAVETGHSTAREAAQVAAQAGVRQLVLTHFSARYSRDPSDLDREAKEVFPRVTIARDGMEIDIPFGDGR
jgi:ribonuclease Z